MKSPLSNELKVACEILAIESKGDAVWYAKLQRNLVGELSGNTIRAAIDTLFEWNLITAEYGPTDSKRAGRLLHVASDQKALIQELYDRYWKNRNVIPGSHIFTKEIIEEGTLK